MSEITSNDKQEFVITPPESPPRINMDQPDFDKLTPAEKLNDRKYREQIYQAYPDEPTCFCVPADKRSANPMICRAGCTKSCCMTLRNPNALEPKPDECPATTICDRNISMKGASNKANQSAVRLRGGGSKDYLFHSDLDLTSSKVQVKSLWQNNKVNSKDVRLSGGAADCCGRGMSGTGVTTIFETPRFRKRPPDPCSPRQGGGAVPAGCMCPSKEPATTRKSKGACTKKPCLGIDCLIQAFQEAQEFVDSLGKVPGLVGLGLMDPSESPYFGRGLNRDYPTHEAPVEKKKVQTGDKVVSTVPVARCVAPCAKPLSSVKSGHAFASSYTTFASTPFTIAVPGRTGVVREAIPSLPNPSSVNVSIKPKKKEDKKEEKVEKKEPEATSFSPADHDTGPCGESRCRSRRKRSHHDSTGFDSAESSPETEKTHVKPSHRSAAGRFCDKGKQRKGKTVSTAGPGGDHKSGTGSVKSHQIKVSKRIMRYVYSIGDVYPGINYGHKNCIDPRLRVPANMGWLWNTRATVGKLKPRIGWRPGAIARYLNELLKEAKAGSLEEDKDSRARSVPSRVRRGKMIKSMSYSSVKKMQTKKEDEEEIELPPTLHIHRKDGVYYVTMYPIKQEPDEKNIPRLEEPTKPLQFKIVKNKDDASIASSSTASDMEIEFSPPAAINRYRKKPDLVHVDTQVKQQEILDAYKPGMKTDGVKKKEKKPKKERKVKK